MDGGSADNAGAIISRVLHHSPALFRTGITYAERTTHMDVGGIIPSGTAIEGLSAAVSPTQVTAG